jgi:hypothetical protein
VSPEAVMATLFAGMFAYLGAEMALSSQPHPTHWAVALLFAGLGFAGGEVFHRVKEPF